MSFFRRYPAWCDRARQGLVLVAMVVGGILPGAGRVLGQDAQLERADRILREAGRELASGNYDAVRIKANEVAKLLPDSAAAQQRAAELLYLSGHPLESLPLFDRVVELSPEDAPHNWQRGIALCTCGDFKRGAEQFKTHHDVNPDDVENSAWYFLCVAKLEDMEAAQKTVIPSRGDGRQPMMAVLQLLQGKIMPDEVIAAADVNTREGRARQMARFYADLYVGLYYDSADNTAEAKKYLKRSLGYGVDGYMVDTARVYLEHRFQANTDSAKPAIP